MIDPTGDQVEALARTLCSAFYADAQAGAEAIFDGLSSHAKGNWRRAARAGYRDLDRLFNEPPGPVLWVARCGVCDTGWSHEGEHNPHPKGTFCPECRSKKRMAPGVLTFQRADASNVEQRR